MTMDSDLNGHIYDVIIIGAGASGLYCAAQLKHKRVLVIEKNKKVGLKILASGSGQCNLTHGGYIKDFYECYGDKKNFVKPALLNHDNRKVKSFYESMGVKLFEREDGKVFPCSLKASEIVEALMKACRQNHVTFKLNSPVTACHALELPLNEERRFKVDVTEGCFYSKFLVMATGGKSYKALGTNGDGYVFAENFGHIIKPLKPGLTGVVTRSKELLALQGLAVEKVMVSHVPLSGKMTRYSGALLFTHFGLSGPVIINNSRSFDRGESLTINFLAEEAERVERAFIQCVEQHGENPLAYYINQIKLPDALKTHMLERCQLAKDIKLAVVTKVQRKQLIKQMTQYDVEIESLIGFQQAMVTVGGVSCEEIDAKTMASSKVRGLYIVGETLDVDGDTGGYNLQWAFSSGYAAALDIMKSEA